MLVHRNLGDGQFEEVSKAWGFDSKPSPMAWPWEIWFNDGDMDVVINPLNHPALLYQNHVRIQLEGMR